MTALHSNAPEQILHWELPHSEPASLEDVRDALKALRSEGWRIINDDSRCKNPDAGMACGCETITFSEEYKPTDARGF